MVRKVYIDNSVIGGKFDPEFEKDSLKLFKEFDMGLFQPVISTITEEEISGAPNEVIDFFRKLKQESDIISPTDEAIELAKEYMRIGKFTKKMFVDTLHIATATVYKIDIITSWNFKHIVNLNRIQIYNSVNVKYGYPIVEIRTPKEIIHG